MEKHQVKEYVHAQYLAKKHDDKHHFKAKKIHKQTLPNYIKALPPTIFNTLQIDYLIHCM